MDNGLCKKSGIITIIILSLILSVIYLIDMRTAHPYGTQSVRPTDIGVGGRATQKMYLQPVDNIFRWYFGSQSVTGSGTTGYLSGDPTDGAYIEYNTGSDTINIVNSTLQNNGADVGLAGSLSAYLLANAGTGTDNQFANPTLSGIGTLTATLNASGVDISPAEIGYLDNTDSEIEVHFTTVENDLIAHTHTGVGTDSVQISHGNLTGTGTNSHAAIDTFIDSKSQASGLASLDAAGLVEQNPASGTTTPTAGGIIIADGSGKAADGWLSSNITKLGTDIQLGTETTGNTDDIAEGDVNKYYTDARVNAAVGSLSVSAHSDIIFTSPAEGHKLVFDAGLNVVNATDTALVDWSGITGIPTGNGSITVSSTANTIPIRGSDGDLFVAGIVGGTTTGALRIPAGFIAQRPASPEIGMVRTIAYYVPSGGSITTFGTYTIHTFTTSGEFSTAGVDSRYNVEFYDGASWTTIGTGTPVSIDVDIEVEYLVVAGGGGGRSGNGGGGGGAGGFLVGTTVLSGSNTVTIGGGGAVRTNGSDSSIGAIIVAVGGGSGGANAVPGNTGGSGAGATTKSGVSTPGTGTAGQGYPGGTADMTSSYANEHGGGGGGAGAAGGNAASNLAGNGGVGLASNISGSSVYYAGGGGAGGTDDTGSGGNGGGGGGSINGTAVAGTPNTGGGGGGSGYDAGEGTPGIGGSGIVIIRYPTP